MPNRPMTEGNAAYDMLVYRRGTYRENKRGGAQSAPTSARRSSETLKLRRVNRTSSLPTPNKSFRSFNKSQLKMMISAGLALGILGMFVVVNINYEAKKNELATTIAQREAELQTLKNDYDGLMVEYDTRMSDSAIQEYAEKELGMQKRGNFQLEWISVGEQNDFENDENQNNGFIDWLASYFD